MSLVTRVATPMVIGLVVALLLVSVESPRAQVPTLPSEMPSKVQPTNDGFEYVRRDAHIRTRRSSAGPSTASHWAGLAPAREAIRPKPATGPPPDRSPLAWRRA